MITADKAWQTALKEILMSQMEALPIKGALSDTTVTHEVLNHTLIMDMAWPQISIAGRPNIAAYAAAEALMIICGSNDLDFTPMIRATLNKWAEDNFFIKAAYGPKFIDQCPYILRTFKYDLNSRRAYINIWRESPSEGKDTTCLTSLQYIIRDGKLNCIANMRSSDAYLGLPNDINVFSFVSFAVMLWLNQQLNLKLEIGRLYCNAGSRHIYAKDLQKVLHIVNNVELPRGRKAELQFYNIKDFKSWLTMLIGPQSSQP